MTDLSFSPAKPDPAPFARASGYLPESSADCATDTSADVGERLSDEAREIAIHRAGDALMAAYNRKEAAYRRYLDSSCLTDRADMDAADMQARQALRLMEGLIKGRSAAQVARMERERGIA